ncbi:PF00070 family, FAD-dependent NAD(P)-disulfide oxidoreductase [Thioalkalivibrio nitratireducens DSM 14787]|uniref:PF00070 family, FAD-dependent NAD(P)-disulfide oxidoreductase n=2 Tax=Thioalkalivibrio nitratireducens TaxID=186931 RepID=L0DSS7_THIND|nr:PF00070 family, FAD-dependent NAD(P)-disulfide oxidoreductase [Thioalkalivibrio nitratireducens DSM 14787]
MNIAVIESERVGGSCVNWGCTPTKTLIASARAAHMAHRGDDFGIRIPDFSIRFDTVMDRVNGIRMPSSEQLESWLEKVAGFYPGAASFVDAHTVAVDGTAIHGEVIVIHTGTRSRTPPIPGIETVPWLDNRGILGLTEVPEHLLVFGASYIGLEFAQAYRRLGSQVSVFDNRERIASHEDPDVSAIALEILLAEGIEFYLGAEATRLAPGNHFPDGAALTCRQADVERTVEGAHLLIAVGRVPNTDRLNLDAAGIAVDEQGFIPLDDVGRTSIPHIYALGDVNGRGAFTHTSVHDGQVFLDHLTGGQRKISDRTPIYSMFIDPPLARVGLSETEARQGGKAVLMATMPMSKVNRAREKDETAGLIKILVDEESDRILGATVFGVGGDEVIGMLALAIHAKLPYRVLQETLLPHPTVSEMIPWVFPQFETPRVAPAPVPRSNARQHPERFRQRGSCSQEIQPPTPNYSLCGGTVKSWPKPLRNSDG